MVFSATKPIVTVASVGKQYRIGSRQQSYSTLRETLSAAVSAPVKRLRQNGGAENDTVEGGIHITRPPTQRTQPALPANRQ